MSTTEQPNFMLPEQLNGNVLQEPQSISSNSSTTATPLSKQSEQILLKLEYLTEENKFIDNCFICKLCGGIIWDPHSDQCGHTCCYKCFQKHFIKAKAQICPISGNPTQIFPIDALSKTVKSVRMRCKNKEAGCKWEGGIEQFMEHIKNECPKESIQCSFPECQCFIQREKMIEHQSTCIHKPQPCQYCGLEISLIRMKQHIEVCPIMPIKCPNNCDVVITRELFESHLSCCQNVMVSCPFESFGCTEKYMKKDMAEHDVNYHHKHLELLLNEIQSLKKTIKELESKKDSFQCSEFNKNVNWISVSSEKKEKIFRGKRQREDTIIIDDEEDNIQIDIKKEQLRPKSPKGQKYLFDYTHLPNCIRVDGNNIVSMPNPAKSHQFAISTMKMDKTNPTKWQYEIMEPVNGWLGLGVCDRKKVSANRMKFFSPNLKIIHGCFLFSVNKFLWNHNVKEENNLALNIPDLVKGDKISFLYLPEKKLLEFDTGKYQGKLTKVEPIIDKELYMCIVFLNGGNSVRVIY